MSSPKEIWVPVVGYEGFYDVSNLGNVRSYHNGKWGCSDKPRLLKAYQGKHYKYVFLCGRDRRGHAYIHRLVAEAFIPNPNNYGYINHIDGNKLNNSVENLEWCTQKHNIQHALSSGLLRSRRVRNKRTGQVFPSVKAASIEAGVCRSCLDNYLRGITKKETVYKRRVIDYELV